MYSYSISMSNYYKISYHLDVVHPPFKANTRSKATFYQPVIVVICELPEYLL